MPEMVPVKQVQPNQEMYGFDVLNLYPRLTRAKYLEMFGEQAPAWNPEKRIKRWFDSGAAKLPPDAMYLDPTTGQLPFYYQVDKSTLAAAKVSIFITNADAAVPNLPGKFSYPKYVPKPSGLFVPVGIQKQYLPDDQLSTVQEAMALIKEFKEIGLKVQDSPQETNFSGMFSFVPDPGENRRVYVINVNDQWLNVGLLIASRSAAGVGAPGHWAASNEGAPVRWISSIPADIGEQDIRPEIPTPQRELMPNERVAFGGLMSDPVIRRVDLGEKSMPEMIREMYLKIMRLPF